VAGDAQPARKLDEKVLADYRKIFGDDHPRTRKITRRLDGEKTTSGMAELDKGISDHPLPELAASQMPLGKQARQLRQSPYRSWHTNS
jgi:hypothetical protein